MDDLVSIITPAYNTAECIGKTIQSVLAQTYSNWELLIVDDCSTDNTREIIESFGDPRIRYLKNEKNSGAAISRNYGLREAKGKWIAFIDSDDLWAPEKLEKQIRFMKENNYAFTCTDYCMVSPDGQLQPHIYTGPEWVNKKILYRYCYFSTITVMYDRETVGLVQIADIRKHNDYAMWLQIIEKANCYRLQECLSCYCRRENSISSVNKWTLIKYHYILFRKALGKDVVSSVFLTANNLFFGVLKKLLNKREIRPDELKFVSEYFN